MKRLVWLVALLIAVSAIAADLPKEITLQNGTVLRGVTVQRWEKDGVVIRYVGGVAPVKFRHMAEQSRSVWELAANEGAASAAADASKTRTVTGTVFITTKGAGAYKFAGARVAAYPIENIEFAKAGRVADGGAPIATATTDADGKFSLALPGSKSAFLYCVARRLLKKDDYETNIWIVPVGAKEVVDLNGSNTAN